jgi:hypothetical protein
VRVGISSLYLGACLCHRLIPNPRLLHQSATTVTTLSDPSLANTLANPPLATALVDTHGSTKEKVHVTSFNFYENLFFLTKL